MFSPYFGLFFTISLELLFLLNLQSSVFHFMFQQILTVQRPLEVSHSCQLLLPLIKKGSLVCPCKVLLKLKVFRPLLQNLLDLSIGDFLEFIKLLSPLAYFLLQFFSLLLPLFLFSLPLLFHCLLKLFSFVLHFLHFFVPQFLLLLLSLLSVNAQFSYQ